MADLAGPSRADLRKAEAACKVLLDLHSDHGLPGPELFSPDLLAGLGALQAGIRLIRQDRARQRRLELAGRADPVPAARMKAGAGAPLAVLARMPAGCLEVAGLDEVAGRELAARRAWLLRAIASARPGPEVPGTQAPALALAAVTAELGIRALLYATDPRSPRRCSCGYRCRGLAAIDDHLDQFPPGSEEHYEEQEDT